MIKLAVVLLLLHSVFGTEREWKTYNDVDREDRMLSVRSPHERRKYEETLKQIQERREEERREEQREVAEKEEREDERREEERREEQPEAEEKERREEEEALRGIARRVIGGMEIAEGVWPWLVSLQGEIPTSKVFGFTISSVKTFCSASLVADQWILTAAHCFDNEGSVPSKYRSEAKKASNYVARVADTELDSSFVDKLWGIAGKVFDKDDWKLRDWEIDGEKIFIHPGYDKNKRWVNDIALMKLEEKVPAQPTVIEEIQSINLARDSSFPIANQNCTFKGWGCTRSGGRVSQTASQVSFPIINDNECKQLWRIDTSTRLCAGYHQAGKGICPGDSGGPLVCKAGPTWIQVGVASFTAAEKPGQYPGAFTRVSAFYSWIRNIVNNN